MPYAGAWGRCPRYLPEYVRSAVSRAAFMPFAAAERAACREPDRRVVREVVVHIRKRARGRRLSHGSPHGRPELPGLLS